MHQNTSLSKSKANATKPRTSIEICSSCFQKIGKGIRHSWTGSSSSTRARDNVFNIVEQLPEKQQNQIVTTLLKRKISNSDKEAKSELLLNTSGSKVRVTVNKEKENKTVFSAQSLDNFQVNTASSTNYMKKLVHFIRSSAGRTSVPTNYNQHMYEKSKMMEHIYKEDFCDFETFKGGIKKRPVVYANTTELLDFVLDKRNVEHIEQSKIKVMADGGQDFFKISIAISTHKEHEENESDKYKSKNVSYYATGGSIANERKLTSVYKLILLCIVPRIKETYENFKTLV